MNKQINMFWYKHNKGHGNFGDELNPYIIERLTKKKVNYLPIPDTIIRRILKLAKRLILNKISFKDSISVVKSLYTRKYYIAIGSIISLAKGKNCHVWGAGLMKKDELINECKFFAVRGKITQKRIEELGYNTPQALGDPALLLPLIYQPNKKKMYDLGIIPHFVQLDELSGRLIDNKENILIIDLLNDIETIINQINSCKTTVTSSLHGLIVSHAYGIPSLWCNFGESQLPGDDIKFDDYFSSANIPFYKKTTLNLNNNLVSQASNLFKEFSEYSIIKSDVNEIQKNLIKHAPFQVMDKFKE